MIILWMNFCIYRTLDTGGLEKSMSKHTSQPLPQFEESSSTMEFIAQHKAVQWVAQHGRYVLWGLFALAAISVFYYRSQGSSNSAIAPYFKADIEYETFVKNSNPLVEQESLNGLFSILEKIPSLHGKYDAGIAQTLLNRDQVIQALPYANGTLARTEQNQLPDYASFARTTLLIGEKKYDEALQSALGLKTTLETGTAENRQAQQSLYLMNLLRIASLYEEKGAVKEEINAWQQFKAARTLFPQAFDLLTGQLQEGQISLMQYIEAREKVLASFAIK